MTDIQHFREQLSKRRQYLLGKADEIEDKFERSGDEPFDGDSGEISNLEVLDDLDDMAQSELRAINAAMERIAGGTYGNCVTCGDPIDRTRLEVLPHTPFCKIHA